MLNPEAWRRRRRVRRVGRILTDLVQKYNGDKEAIEKELELAIPWILLMELAIRLLPVLLDIFYSCEFSEGQSDESPSRLFERCAKGKIRALADICSTDQESIAWTAEDAEDDDMPLDARFLRWISSNYEIISDEMDEGFDD